jgi:hypothetical protein
LIHQEKKFKIYPKKLLNRWHFLLVEKIREEILILMTLLQIFGNSSFHYQAINQKFQKEIKLRYF